MIGRIAAGCGVVAAAGVLTAAPARADDQGYLDYLRDHGVPVGSMLATPSKLLQGGDTACRFLRDGMDPQDAAQQFGPISSAMYGTQVVDAAQHELCPDTLG